MKKLTLLVALLIAGTANAQITFQKTFGGSDVEYGYVVQQTNDGGYIMLGETYTFTAGWNELYVIKTDANGNIQWTKAIGGQSAADYSGSIQQTSDFGYIITGTLITTSYDVHLIKIDANGNILWSKTYGGTDMDEGYYVQQTSDGGYIIVGETKSYGVGSGDVYLIKTDSVGDTLWTKTYGGTNWDVGLCVKQTTDAGYIITGNTISFGAGVMDIYLIKTDSVGDTLWTKTFGGIDYELGSSVQQTTDGGFIITGYTQSFGIGAYAVYLIKTDANGDSLWTKTFGGTSADIGNSVQLTTDGGYIIAGETGSFGGGVGNNVYLIKTDAIGDTLWTKTYGGISYEGGHSVQQTTDGGYIIAATTGSFGAGGSDIYLIKTDALGNSGCYESGTNTIVGSAAFIIGSGATVGFGGVVSNTTTSANNTATVVDVQCSNVGINQLAIGTEQIAIYPNPTEGKFRVESSKFGVEKVEVYDLFGRKVLVSKEQEIDMGGFPKGIYFVRVDEVVQKVILL